MGRNKNELIKLAEKITGQECKDVLTKKDALKKIACYYLGEEKEFASIADCLESIVEHGATGGLGDVNAIWGDNSSTANVGDKITLSMTARDVSGIYVGVQGEGSSLMSAKVSDVIDAGTTGVELLIIAGPEPATVKVTATLSGNTLTITFSITKKGEFITKFSAFAWK